MKARGLRAYARGALSVPVRDDVRPAAVPAERGRRGARTGPARSRAVGPAVARGLWSAAVSGSDRESARSIRTRTGSRESTAVFRTGLPEPVGPPGGDGRK